MIEWRTRDAIPSAQYEHDRESRHPEQLGYRENAPQGWDALNRYKSVE